MRILIVSDSHGKTSNLFEAINRVKPDKIFHLGDGEGQEEFIRSEAGCPLEIVRGNCDFMSHLPNRLLFSLGKHVVMMTHGHLYHANSGTEQLIQTARENQADVIMYGHTHIPEITYEKDMTVINPGSISLPRQEGHRPSYIVLDVDRAGELHFTLNFI